MASTPRKVENPTTGQIVWRWDADPFGTTAPDEDPDGDTIPFTLPLRFPGQVLDSETGLHYNYFRDYEPATGRYVQSDPIGLDGGVNTYAYSLSSPASNADPLGLLTWRCIASSSQGVGYRGSTKLCSYSCSAQCDGKELKTTVTSPGFNTSFGSHCEGYPIGTQMTPLGVMSDNPIGPPDWFTVDTSGFKRLWDWLKYPSELTDALKDAESQACCED